MTKRAGTDDYWSNSATPLASLIFVAPLLLVYELGIIALGPHAMRNGAEQWLRYLLDSIGFGQYLLLPIVTCCMLIGWHHTTRERWKVSSGTLSCMLGETLLVAFALVGLAILQSAVWSASSVAVPAAVETASTTGTARMVGYFGAGIYEETLFRLMLIPAIAHGLRALGESPKGSLWGAAVAASLIFSAAHYQAFTGIGDTFLWSTFVFRFGAGMVFSALFIHRGFGITAGAHTAYDLALSLC